MMAIPSAEWKYLTIALSIVYADSYLRYRELISALASRGLVVSEQLEHEVEQWVRENGHVAEEALAHFGEKLDRLKKSA